MLTCCKEEATSDTSATLNHHHLTNNMQMLRFTSFVMNISGLDSFGVLVLVTFQGIVTIIVTNIMTIIIIIIIITYSISIVQYPATLSPGGRHRNFELVWAMPFLCARLVQPSHVPVAVYFLCKASWALGQRWGTSSGSNLNLTSFYDSHVLSVLFQSPRNM